MGHRSLGSYFHYILFFAADFGQTMILDMA